MFLGESKTEHQLKLFGGNMKAHLDLLKTWRGKDFYLTHFLLKVNKPEGISRHEKPFQVILSKISVLISATFWSDEVFIASSVTR